MCAFRFELKLDQFIHKLFGFCSKLLNTMNIFSILSFDVSLRVPIIPSNSAFSRVEVFGMEWDWVSLVGLAELVGSVVACFIDRIVYACQRYKLIHIIVYVCVQMGIERHHSYMLNGICFNVT